MKCATALMVAALLVLGVAAPVPAEGTDPGERIELRGRVVRVELEGGFWGLVSADGRHFDPAGLPPRFQQEGLEVDVTAVLLKDVVSFRMWGQPIRILDIRGVPAREP